METGKSHSFFLGANSSEGFYSLYDGFTDPAKGDLLWIIKGGPGCGKSSFMRRIGTAAQKAGLEVETILCSGDPDSLDGIYVPEKKIAYVDGTAPHVQEAACPGAGQMYLDLGRFYDWETLRPKLTGLMDLNRRYKAEYARTYQILAGARSLAPHHLPERHSPQEEAAAARRAAALAAKLLHKNEKAAPGKIKKRFISAFTCQGHVFLRETVSGLCSQVITLDDRCGLAESFLRSFGETARRWGYDLLLCPDPMEPDRLEAILIPEAGIGLLAIHGENNWEGPARHIRLDAMVDAQRLRELRPRMRSNTKLYQQMLAEAKSCLSQAKALHDRLEAVYNPYVDFDGVYREADIHIARLLS